MGTGTAPEEGAALAVALLEEFRARRALTLATTHHDRLKAYASTTPGIVNAAMEFDEETSAADVPAAGRRARHVERNRNRAAAGTAGARRGARAGEPFAGIARGARPDRLSPSQPRRNGETSSGRRARNWRSWKRSGARCRPNGSSGRRSASPNSRRSFRETQKRLEAEVARLMVEIKGPRTARPARKAVGRRMGKIESDARAEADAAVVETLAASQADLGVAVASAAKAGCAGAAFRRTANHGERIQAAGDFSPARWAHGRSRSRAAADEGASRGYCRHRRRRSQRQRAAPLLRARAARHHRSRAAERRARRRRNQRDRLHGGGSDAARG